MESLSVHYVNIKDFVVFLNSYRFAIKPNSTGARLLILASLLIRIFGLCIIIILFIIFVGLVAIDPSYPESSLNFYQLIHEIALATAHPTGNTYDCHLVYTPFENPTSLLAYHILISLFIEGHKLNGFRNGAIRVARTIEPVIVREHRASVDGRAPSVVRGRVLRLRGIHVYVLEL